MAYVYSRRPSGEDTGIGWGMGAPEVLPLHPVLSNMAIAITPKDRGFNHIAISPVRAWHWAGKGCNPFQDFCPNAAPLQNPDLFCSQT